MGILESLTDSSLRGSSSSAFSFFGFFFFFLIGEAFELFPFSSDCLFSSYGEFVSSSTGTLFNSSFVGIVI